MAERSRRRLSYSSVSTLGEQGEVCGLCSRASIRTSKYPSWTDKSSQQCVQSLGVDAQSPVCRACRDDVSRLVKNSAFTPRWEKEKQYETCVIQSCNGKDLHYSHTITSDELIAFGLDIPDVIPTPFPLCKHHYYTVKKKIAKPQTHCPMCNISVRNIHVRSCPNSDLINKILLQQTGFEGNLSNSSKVCFSCYKCQLELLKETQLSSTDSDLSHLIATLNSKQVPLKCASTDVIDTAMHYTSIFVAEILLQGESLLLPMVHTFFDKKVQELVGKHNINIDEINVSVTSRWILSNLTISLAHHLSCACKVKKHGTILYRTNGDILLALSKALHKQKNCSTEENPTIATTEELSNDSVLLDKAAECLNKSFQTQIRKYLLEDKVAPFQFDQLNIDNCIADLNPTIWRFICRVTQSWSQSSGRSKVCDTTTHEYHVKKLRRFTCMCTLMYCIDDRCYLPLHCIITDLIESCGGSTKLIRYLNRLGICSSLDTLSRVIQQHVKMREHKGPEQELCSSAMIVVSADNIDFLHKNMHTTFVEGSLRVGTERQ